MVVCIHVIHVHMEVAHDAMRARMWTPVRSRRHAVRAPHHQGCATSVYIQRLPGAT